MSTAKGETARSLSDSLCRGLEARIGGPGMMGWTVAGRPLARPRPLNGGGDSYDESGSLE